MSTMKDFLAEDGGMAMNIAFFNRFRGEDSDFYFEAAAGDWYAGVLEWSLHTISDVEECSNHKYHGYTIHWESGNKTRLVIPNWVMDIQPNGWNHAKNLFNKYLRTIVE